MMLRSTALFADEPTLRALVFHTPRVPDAPRWSRDFEGQC